MKDLLLDTCVLSKLYAGSQEEQEACLQYLKKQRELGNRMRTSPVVIGEIQYGLQCIIPSDNEFERQWNANRSHLPQILSVTEHTAIPYSKVRAALFKKFGPNRKGIRVEQLKRPFDLPGPRHSRERSMDRRTSNRKKLRACFEGQNETHSRVCKWLEIRIALDASAHLM